MKIHNEQITLQTTKPREIVNITTRVKAAMEKSGLRDGVIVVSSLHTNSAVIVNDEEAGLREDLDQWLSAIAPADSNFKHPGRSEGNAAVHFQTLLLGHQILAPFSEGRLDLGPWQSILFVELDGLRPKRILIKVIGE
jgi:secondary thiamine-phosphate synthase enzyme